MFIRQRIKDLRTCYLDAYPNARHWVYFDDFSFYRMDVSGVYFVGGFGMMGWVSKADYQQAEPDLLMHVAEGVIQHMNEDHADALILLARHQGGLDADEVRMVGVDRLGFDVKVRMSEQQIRGARIAFPSPLNDAADVRSMFVMMVQETEESSQA